MSTVGEWLHVRQRELEAVLLARPTRRASVQEDTGGHCATFFATQLDEKFRVGDLVRDRGHAELLPSPLDPPISAGDV